MNRLMLSPLLRRSCRALAVLGAMLALVVTPALAQNADAEPLRIVATTTQAYDLALIVAGDLADDEAGSVEIIGLMGAGVDPHLYKPTESDIQAMNLADAVIYSGLNLEGQFGEVFEALSERGVTIYALSDPVKDAGFTIGGFDLSDELQNVDDPHFWFDPRNWQMSTTGLAETLAQLDPDNAETYLANAEAYNEQLDLLFAWADEGLKSVPASQRYLVSSHDAFQYFGAAFGWKMAAIQGISTAAEAGVGDIQDTVNFVIDNGIPVMFVESSVPPATVEAVQEAVEAAGGTVSVGVRELYSDAMGEREAFSGRYVGMIAENVLTILQSYQLAGVDLEIPAWPEALNPQPPVELLAMSE